MSSKREKPQEGLHGTILPKNTGKEYTKFEYFIILFLTVRGIQFDQIGVILNRPERCIRQAWRRLRLNASAYKGVKEYDLPTPDCAPLIRLNGKAQEYVYCQWRNSLASVDELARRLCCSNDLVRDAIDIQDTKDEDDDDDNETIYTPEQDLTAKEVQGQLDHDMSDVRGHLSNLQDQMDRIEKMLSKGKSRGRKKS